MSEWFKVPVLKTGMLFKVSGVRILPHPYELHCYAVLAFSKLLLFATGHVKALRDATCEFSRCYLRSMLRTHHASRID